MKELYIENLFSLENTVARELFCGKTYPWEILPLLKDFILSLGACLSAEAERSAA